MALEIFAGRGGIDSNGKIAGLGGFVNVGGNI